MKLISPRAAWDGMSEAEVSHGITSPAFSLEYHLLQAKAELIRKKVDADELKLQRFVRSKGQFFMNIGALPSQNSAWKAWPARLWDRVHGIRSLAYSMNHTVTVSILLPF